jgi:hypothetical protein
MSVFRVLMVVAMICVGLGLLGLAVLYAACAGMFH